MSLILAGHSVSEVENTLEQMALGEKGPDAIAKLSLQVSIFNCMVIQNEIDQITTLSNKAIDMAVECLNNNAAFINNKINTETRIMNRYIAMWCSNLTLFRNQVFIGAVSARRLEFSCDQYLNFLKIAIKKDPKVAYVSLLSYAMTEIPSEFIPEMPK